MTDQRKPWVVKIMRKITINKLRFELILGEEGEKIMAFIETNTRGKNPDHSSVSRTKNRRAYANNRPDCTIFLTSDD